MKRTPHSYCWLVVLIAFYSLPATAKQPSPSPLPASAPENVLPPEICAQIDKAASDILKDTGAPSASIAIVKDGKLAYVRAYGKANIEAHKPATPTMRYSIGSISKQFTSTAILLLAQEGKLSLDDPIARWLPEATRAGEVTVRQLLSMTAGYQDYWAQDYVMPSMTQPVFAQDIVARWAGKPLDFEPGTKWQYSNTNYIMAGLIVERAAGMPLFDFLKQRIFGPLQLSSVFNVDEAPLGPDDPMRYERIALGPARPAPKEGKGWLFAAGELAMTATDLATWDISVINGTILQSAAYHEMQTEVQLRNGAGSHYGLGVGVNLVNARRLISHTGEVSGFSASNAIYPDDRVAVVVLTNLVATRAARDLTAKISEILFTPAGNNAPMAGARNIFAALQHGKIDRSRFTSNANAYFSNQALKDLAASLGPLGAPLEFSPVSEGLRGGMTSHTYKVRFARKTFGVSTYTMPDGKLEQYIVAPE